MNTGVSPRSEGPPAVPRISTLPASSAVLCEHPAVRDAAACRLLSPDGQAVVAFVLAEGNYVDDALGRKEVESNQLRRWRKTYDLTQLTKAAAASEFAFNTLGWKSSYTRQPIPPEDMMEWVHTTVERISALRPEEVLEIGCGTGMLLLRLAPACKRYVALDFAPAVLMRLQEELKQTEDLREKVELLERSADNFEGFREGSFDIVVINSVAQYFPSQAYLDRVVENALRVVKPGGHVFVGDQRNLVLVRAYAASIERFQASPETNVAELRGRIERRLQQEQQLVLSPSYFLSLPQRLSTISHVEIHPRRGSRDNEMTCFRFDAILRVGTGSMPRLEISFLDPPSAGWQVNEMRALLTAGKTNAVGFARVSNSRVEKDMRLLALLAGADPLQTLGELQEGRDEQVRGIHPEEILGLAAETGYKAAISWASCYTDGSYDVAFVRQRSSDDNAFPAIEWPPPSPADFVYFTNAPGQGKIWEKLVDELLSHCRLRLPDELVPGRLYPVDSFPRESDGSVDFDALVAATQKPAQSS
jgi:ubiquinone/menaquinone biosynthesis C-methylase UbiE